MKKIILLLVITLLLSCSSTNGFKLYPPTEWGRDSSLPEWGYMTSAKVFNQGKFPMTVEIATHQIKIWSVKFYHYRNKSESFHLIVDASCGDKRRSLHYRYIPDSGTTQQDIPLNIPVKPSDSLCSASFDCIYIGEFYGDLERLTWKWIELDCYRRDNLKPMFGVYDDKKLLNVKQASDLLGVSEQLIHRLITELKIPACKHDGQWHFDRKTLQEWAAEESNKKLLQEK